MDTQFKEILFKLSDTYKWKHSTVCLQTVPDGYMTDIRITELVDTLSGSYGHWKRGPGSELIQKRQYESS